MVVASGQAQCRIGPRSARICGGGGAEPVRSPKRVKNNIF